MALNHDEKQSYLLTVECKRARAKAKPHKLNDGGGLYLFVTPSGGKLWRFDYPFMGKRKTLSIGAFPRVSLDAARAARDAARKKVEAGIDPMAAKKADKLTREMRHRTTFALVAEELLERYEREGKAEATIKKRRWLLTDLASDLADRPVAQITAPEVLAVLRKAESRGHLESARRLRAVIGHVLRSAVATGRATLDFTPSLRGEIAAPQVKNRPAIIEPENAGRLMEALSGYDGAVMRCALLLSAYCFPRPGELRLAKWNEVNLRKRVWTIPAERTKMRREHRVPLSPQAYEQFRTLRRLTGDNEDGYCFPGLRSGRPISENTLNAALRTLGFDTSKVHCAHGFRATASSLLNEQSDFAEDVIERSLAHRDKSATRGTYNRATYWDERVRMMAWYADYLDTLRKTARTWARIES